MDAAPKNPGGEGRRLLGLVELKRGEARTVALAAAYSFCLLSINNVLKPYRDALGTAVPGLSGLWGGTLIACLVVLPPYWVLVARLPRQRFIPWVHRFFEALFVLFFFLLHDEKSSSFPVTARVFYATVSALNLLLISQFWGFMADVFDRDQGQRLFGWIAAGGTLGGLLASYAVSWTQGRHLFAPAHLVWPTIALLELASLFAGRVAARAAPSDWRPPPRSDLASHFHDVAAGAVAFARSPYLLAIAAFMFVNLLTNGFVYDFLRVMVQHAPGLKERAAQTALYADINLWTQVLAIAGQLLLSARLLSAAGVAITLAILPVCAAAGLTTFALVPTLVVIQWVQIGLRGIDYALTKPAREALFTVVSRAEKYQSKSLIDAGLYRAFDWIDSVLVDLSRSLGSSTCAWLLLPFAGVGVALSGALARMQTRRLRVEAPLQPVEEP